MPALTYRILCLKGYSLCQPRPRKTPGGICGAKWWCYECGRYILPDDNHLLYSEGSMVTGTLIFEKEKKK